MNCFTRFLLWTKNLDDPVFGPAAAAFAWIAAGTIALSDSQETELAGSVSDEASEVKALPWGLLGDSLAKWAEADQRTPETQPQTEKKKKKKHTDQNASPAPDERYRASLRREWLIRVACLFLPEFGIPGLDVKLLGLDRKDGALKNFWQQHHDAIEARRERFNYEIECMGSEFHGLAKELKAENPPILNLV